MRHKESSPQQATERNNIRKRKGGKEEIGKKSLKNVSWLEASEARKGIEVDVRCEKGNILLTKPFDHEYSQCKSNWVMFKHYGDILQSIMKNTWYQFYVIKFNLGYVKVLD